MFTSSKKHKIELAKKRYEKIVDFKHLSKLSEQIHAKGKKIVFTTGSFEIVTPGHCRFLAEAKSQGGILVVGVCSDRSITKIKGSDFPLINEEARCEMLCYLKSVDYVTLVDEGEPHAAIVLLSPDVFYTNKREIDNGNVDEQAEFLIKRAGGALIISDDQNPYKSARDLIEHVADLRFIEIVASYLWSRGINLNLDQVPGFKPADYGSQTPNNTKAFNPSRIIYDNEDALVKLISAFRKESKSSTLVFVSGGYDLLHVGHARFIEKASILGDNLLVGIPSDTKIRELKGYGRPIISEYSRAYVLASLDFVDGVCIFDETTVLNTLKKVKPDTFFTVKEEWNSGLKNSPEYKYVKGYGGKIALSPRQSPFLSSSLIINKVAAKKVKEIFKDCVSEEKIALINKEVSRFINHEEEHTKEHKKDKARTRKG